MNILAALNEEELSILVTALDNYKCDQEGIYKEQINKLMIYLNEKAKEIKK